LVCKDDLIYVYVDFIPITSTASPDDALALLIAMYTIFELSFNKNSRTVRLLYSCLHGDKRFLSNSIRVFIKGKQIDIYSEQNHQPSITNTHSQSISNREKIQHLASSLESDSITYETATDPLQDNFDSGLHVALVTNE
jgi:hypothetical protein